MKQNTLHTILQEAKELDRFLILWFGQSFSQLSTAMTSFAISIWVFQSTNNALAFSLAALAFLLPDMLLGLFVGPIIDRLNKKFIIIGTDVSSGLCALLLFALLRFQVLEVWHVIAINFVIGILSAFQSPASEVALTSLVPKKHYVRASGLKAFSSGSSEIIAPILAALLMNLWGIEGLILLDVAIMACACVTFLLFVKIPQSKTEGTVLKIKTYIVEIREGLQVVKQSKLLMKLLLLFAFINVVSGITYFNLLTPMLLLRSGDNLTIVSLVKSAMGVGIVMGGISTVLFSSNRWKSKIQIVLLSTLLSFVFGDILLAVTSIPIVWVIAGFGSSVFIPAITSNSNYFWRTIVPIELQGRAFALKNAVGSGMIALGMLSGGLLADHVFEPLLRADYLHFLPFLSNSIDGTKRNGLGMAFLFFLTGIAGVLICIIGLTKKKMQQEEMKLKQKKEI